MQLVYLYIEKYKNIENQGFNFSPEFECNFDSYNLTIKKKSSVSKVFPTDINVTAIVGKNGSGKSSLSEILATFSHQEFLDKKSFLVYFDGNEFTFKQKSTGKKVSFKINNKTKYNYDDKNKARTVDLIYFSNDVATIFNNPKLSSIQTYSHIDAFYNYQTNAMPSNNHLFYKEKIDRLETFNERFRNILKEDKNIFQPINKKIKFDVFQNELHFYEMGVYFVSDKNFLELLNKDKLEEITIFKNLEKNEHLYKLLILFRLIKYEESSQKDINDIVPVIKQDFQKENFSIEDWEQINNKIEKFDNIDDVYTKENLEDLVNRFDYTKNEIWKESTKYKINESIDESNVLVKALLSKLNRVNFLNTLDDEYSYYSLSSGEREYISIFTAYCYHLKRVMSQNTISNSEFIFYFDEIDLGLHPNWQRSIVKDLVLFAQKYTKKEIQLILTSHSPFILSDIPKENIIFLKDGKNVSTEVDINTFGANIHTLLSHGFFMEDGLMGEFAKEKINEVIKLLNSIGQLSDADTERCEDIISVVGEPILKRQLQKMLDSKRLNYLSKDVRDEIEFLKHRIDILSKRT